MTITQLINEKNGFHWIELDHQISFLAHTINNGKYFSVLERIKDLKIAFSSKHVFWFDEGNYESHKNYFITSIGELDEAVQIEIESEIIAEKVLRDWTGINNEKGLPVLFNKEIAKTIITENRRIRNFFVFSAYHSVLEAEIEAQTANEILSISQKYICLTID
ncbi:hypothetical protein [Marinobacter sp.]|uniref:hypothetical protein n=1 Tax=Marinobacter sp. TaxID=50741 RepID=UPI0035C66CA9